MSMYERRGTNFCPIDGCYRMCTSGGMAEFCARHQKQYYRTGSPHVTNERDWVSDSAGAECRICGRSVYEHDVTEFCLLRLREKMEAA